ncbi:hypothetical protein [Pannonibacter tanglangensis]|nr:hypothetical protein [Pannonibacter sp. XCT-34]NBN62113.1 hypothetical protein [Pannonibacter sp. XCT-34]
MIASLWLALLGVSASAEDMPVPGDFFLISRQADGTFSGSHKVLEKPGEGYVAVSYCGRKLWVRPSTVAWTHMEVENRRRVALEFNAGKGWRPLCAEAQNQVRLADLGIEADNFIVANGGSYKQPTVENRFKHISKQFQGKTGKTEKSSTYHSR